MIASHNNLQNKLPKIIAPNPIKKESLNNEIRPPIVITITPHA
jgi:hypothetical protein